MQKILTPIKALTQPQVVIMLFLGISAGIPILLIFSSLSLWLREAGIERSTVTFFSWAALGYSFKFIWAPLVDRLPVPLLYQLLGKRRSWILLAQSAIIAAICIMALTDPAQQDQLLIMAMAAVLLGFASATQDIVIDAYRIESGRVELQALISSSYIAGYRIGMLIAGAGALFLADLFGSSKAHYQYHAWMNSYLIIAAAMLIGVMTTLLMPEPDHPQNHNERYQKRDYAGFFILFLFSLLIFIGCFVLSQPYLPQLKHALTQWLHFEHLAGFVVESLRFILALSLAVLTAKSLLATALVNRDMIVATWVAPVKEFLQRYPLKLSVTIVALIGLYRISDIVLGVISNVFYQDLGFTKTEIAAVVKTFGLFMTIAGGFAGGFISLKLGVMKTLMIGALLTIVTNLMFVLLAWSGASLPMLYLVISADNLTAGLASAAFVAFLSALTNIRFTAIQYAIFSSMMMLVPKLAGGFSGTIVDAAGYVFFFVFAAAIGIPVLWLVYRVQKQIRLEAP